MTADEIIEAILVREGQGTPPYYDGLDAGGRTAWGISERFHPEAWTHGPPSREQAKAIYLRRYVAPFTPLQTAGLDERVRIALIDDAVLSGVTTAIKTLQRVLDVPEDGVIGPRTIAAAVKANHDGPWLLIQVVKQRAHRLARIVERYHDQAQYIVGWIDRCLSHLG